ncbi:MAG: hypothetical protein HZC55_01125 [Verrucomicrobia bacterium]|nr:hypothetical protein [Verrucomicrobiota bacterium]
MARNSPARKAAAKSKAKPLPRKPTKKHRKLSRPPLRTGKAKTKRPALRKPRKEQKTKAVTASKAKVAKPASSSGARAFQALELDVALAAGAAPLKNISPSWVVPIQEEARRLRGANLDWTKPTAIEAEFLKVTALIFARSDKEGTQLIIDTVNSGGDDRFKAFVMDTTQLDILKRNLPGRISLVTREFGKGDYTKVIADDSIKKLRTTISGAVKPKS